MISQVLDHRERAKTTFTKALLCACLPLTSCCSPPAPQTIPDDISHRAPKTAETYHSNAFYAISKSSIPCPDQFIVSPGRNLHFPAHFKGSVAVGPRAVLTAAHNVDDDGVLWIGNNRGCCDIHPDYTNNNTADLALCRMSADLNLSFYEIVNVDTSREAASERILLTGYGCTGGPLGIKTARICKHPHDTHYFIEVNWCLCPGDSGSPAFAVDGDVPVIVGINSERHCDQPGHHAAVLSSTSGDSTVKWMKDWAAGRRPGACQAEVTAIDVCGVHVGSEVAPRCRHNALPQGFIENPPPCDS